MKRKLFITFICIVCSAMLVAQSVSINTPTPDSTAILEVKSNTKGVLLPRTSTISRLAILNPAKGLVLYDSTAAGFYFYNGAQWTPLGSGSSGSPWLISNSDIYSGNTGNIGIGTFIPPEKLTVQTLNNTMGISHRGENGNIRATSMGGTSAGIGTFSHTNMRIFANGISRMFISEANGYVGLATSNPVNKFQIGDTPGFSNYDLGIGNGTQGMVFQQNGGFSNWQSNTNITLLPKSGTGYVGINTTTPANRLQIGSLGPAGFNGNDLAIGNGTNAMVVSQSNATTLIASTTDIVLLPRYGGTGRVGINTSTPRCPLEVAGYIPFAIESYQYAYFALGFSNFSPVANTGGTINGSPLNISIYASDRIVGYEFNAFSDARIKNIIGKSNSAEDLETISSLQITNYTLRDKAKYGNKLFKKIIAQEVEKVYPQVVSKHSDFIPNVYQASSKLTKTADGYLLGFNAPHNISKEAKKIKVLMEGQATMQEVNIVSIPSAHEVMISLTDVKSDRIFVYGEEVNDFRTVDYEGLTTLNISATQELSKLLKKQQLQIDEQNKKIEVLIKTVNLMKANAQPDIVAKKI